MTQFLDLLCVVASIVICQHWLKKSASSIWASIHGRLPRVNDNYHTKSWKEWG